ncbi:Gfo/Idh/MocA family protein [Angustibacter sp. McL0619]|uniref:Gfo/Idh/MocA family protein n=1 Tax=Angustibacter sp. McL0619 TaxID=3415676 RepID=UPI003CE7AEE9
MSQTLGVGILGAGPVTQAIHLPTLARQADRFRVVSVMDVDASVAESVAARAGAEAATTMEAVLDNPEVEVVAVCSPHQFHAGQVAAICAAGKRGILCEKPLATTRDEATQIAEAVTAAGVPLVVGAMHAYDPGWLAALDACADRIDSAHTVRSTIVLPFNDRYEDWATQIASRPAPPAPSGPPDTQARMDRIRGLVLGLSVHDLSLVRTFAPTLDSIDHAEFFTPFGGAISLTAAGRRVDLLAFMRPLWRPDWRLEVWGDDWSLRVQFTPSYVHGGSATAIIRGALGEQRLGPWSHNGYEGEWIELHDLVTGQTQPHHPLSDVLDDLTFTTDIADGAAAAIERGAAA